MSEHKTYPPDDAIEKVLADFTKLNIVQQNDFLEAVSKKINGKPRLCLFKLKGLKLKSKQEATQ